MAHQELQPPTLLGNIRARVQYEWLSKECVYHPALARLIVGGNPVEWHHASASPANTIMWQVLSGNPNHKKGIRPVTFTQASLISAPKDAFRSVERHSREVPVVAFAAHGATLAAIIEGYEMVIRGDLKVGLRVGAAALSATVGMYDLIERRLLPVPSNEVIVENNIPIHNEEGGFYRRFPRTPLQ